MYFSFSPSPPTGTSSYTTAAPMDIPSTSSSRPQSPSCAYPSWPRRSSLSSDSTSDDRATSYISDDDLEDMFPCVFDEAEYTPPTSPYTNRSPEAASSMHQAQVVVDTRTLMRELIAQEKAKKERKQRRRSGSRKSRSGTKPMSPILEAGEYHDMNNDDEKGMCDLQQNSIGTKPCLPLTLELQEDPSFFPALQDCPRIA